MTAVTMCIDLGTSWAKAAVISQDEDGVVRVVRTGRVPSRVSELVGDDGSVRALLMLCEQMAALALEWLPETRFEQVGITGIREGVVAIGADGGVKWAWGNALLSAGPARLMAEDRVLSLQGYLAYALTGRLAMTGSERMAMEGSVELDTPTDLSHGVEYVEIGRSIGTWPVGGGVAVYLGGTDEQAALFGAGLGSGAEVVLATGSFWSIACETSPRVAYPACVRVVPACDPYPSAAMLVGYRWGAMLQSALAGVRCGIEPVRPPWAVGEIVRRWEQEGVPGQIELMELTAVDLARGARTLGIPAGAEVVVHGGGARYMRDFIEQVLDRSGWHGRFLEIEATLLGCWKAGHSVGGWSSP